MAVVFNGENVGVAIEKKPDLQDKSVTITENTTTTYTADEGYDGLSSLSVTVDVGGGEQVETKLQILETDENGRVLRAKVSGVTEVANNLFFSYSSGDSAFSTMTDVELPSDLVRIGNNAFFYCKALSLTSLPEGVTHIGPGAFQQCNQLRLTSLPEGITELSNSAFFVCSNIELSRLPNITSIGSQTFSRCTKLSINKFPDGLTSIGTSAFTQCNGILTLEFPSSVTNIGDSAFQNCSSLNKIKFIGQVPNLSSGVFASCKSLAICDFRACTTVPSLYSTSSLGHKSGCQIVIPDALYDTWTTATNWSALTNVVWVKASEYVEE